MAAARQLIPQRVTPCPCHSPAALPAALPLKPEKTATTEPGFRHTGASVQSAITAYHVQSRNRLLASSISAAVVGNQNVLQNVGGVTLQGVELAASWNLLPHWSLCGSSSSNDAHDDDDVAGSAVVAIRDKQVVGPARTLANLQLGYDDGAAWAQLSAHYTGKRYYSDLIAPVVCIPAHAAAVHGAAPGLRRPAAHAQRPPRRRRLCRLRRCASLNRCPCVLNSPRIC
ncbi:TonB-dependent receptor [Xanthomonas cannabis]|nr:TonB-dependent receptor [Xanthomonas cannabis]